MKKFFSNHINSTFVFFGILFLALIISYFAWGIGYLITEIGQANTTNAAPAQNSGFNIKDAASLNYRGIPHP